MIEGQSDVHCCPAVINWAEADVHNDHIANHYLTCERVRHYSDWTMQLLLPGVKPLVLSVFSYDMSLFRTLLPSFCGLIHATKSTVAQTLIWTRWGFLSTLGDYARLCRLSWPSIQLDWSPSLLCWRIVVMIMGLHFPWAIMVQSYEVFTSRCRSIRGYMASPRSSSTPNLNGDTLRKQVCALMKGLKHGTRTRQSKKLSDVKQTGICHMYGCFFFNEKIY